MKAKPPCLTKCVTNEPTLDPITLQQVYKKDDYCIVPTYYNKKTKKYNNISNCQPEKNFIVNYESYINPELIFQPKFFLKDYYDIETLDQGYEWCYGALKTHPIPTIKRVYNSLMFQFYNTVNDLNNHKNHQILKEMILKEKILQSKVKNYSKNDSKNDFKNDSIDINTLKEVMKKTVQTEDFKSFPKNFTKIFLKIYFQHVKKK